MYEKIPRPLLIIIRGLPGSGKSFIAQQLQTEIGLDEVVILDPDAIDFSSQSYIEFTSHLRIDGVDEKLFPYRYLRNLAYEGSNTAKIIIWNQAFTNADLVVRTIDNISQYATQHGNTLKSIIIELEIDIETAQSRLDQRASAGGHVVDSETFSRFIHDYSTMQDSDVPLLQIDGEQNIERSINAITERLLIL